MQKNPPFSVIPNIFTSVLDALPLKVHRKSLPESFTKLIALLRSRICLLLLGMISELFYILYLLRNFPLLRYFQNYRTDLGGITRYSQTGFLQFVVVFSFLFAIFGLAWWEAHKYRDRATLWTILGFGGIFALTTSFVYPINALDLFFYIARSLILVQHHANPMIIAPAHFSNDPQMQLAALVLNLPSPYGPLTQLIQALPLLIAGRNILASLLLFKLTFSLMIIVEAFFIYKILSQIAPKFALSGALALAWNPFALLEYSANSHNDIVMMFFVILAVFALIKGRYCWAMTLITASALIKYASLVAIPLFFIYSFRQHKTGKSRLIYTIKAIIIFLSVTIDSFALFWAGPQTLQRSLTQAQGYLYSLSIFLVDISSSHLSYNQSRQIGWILFGVCFLYAMRISSRDLSNMLKGCFITMFALLAFGTTFIQPWYFIWPFVFGILIPQTKVSLAAFLLLYGATLAELAHAYIFPWSGSQYLHIFVITNSIIYLMIFLPPLLLLTACLFKPIFSQPSSSQE